MTKSDTRLVFFLWILCLCSVIAALPYVLTTQGEVLGLIPLPLSFLLPLQVAANGVQFAIFIYLGHRLTRRVGLGVPVLTSFFSNEKHVWDTRNKMLTSLLYGVGAGFLIFALDVVLAGTIGGIEILKAYPGQPIPPLWQTILVLPYGAIAEEVALRLFAMSFFAWLFYRIKSDSQGNPTDVGMWLSTIIAALLFGVSHLPAVLFFADVSVIHTLRIVLLNAIGGVVFGWLFWKKGLEYAMAAHLGMDLILHVLLPPFL